MRGNERAYRCDAEKYCFWTHAAFQRGKIPFLPFLNKWWLAEGEGWKRRERIRWLNDEERKIRDRFSPISFSLDRNSFNSVFISPTTISIDRWYILMILRDRSNCFSFRLIFETNIISVYIYFVIDYIVRTIIEEPFFYKNSSKMQQCEPLRSFSLDIISPSPSNKVAKPIC